MWELPEYQLQELLVQQRSAGDGTELCVELVDKKFGRVSTFAFLTK